MSLLQLPSKLFAHSFIALVQDYKEEWGDFIADKHAKKFAAKRDRLLKARQLARAFNFAIHIFPES